MHETLLVSGDREGALFHWITECVLPFLLFVELYAPASVRVCPAWPPVTHPPLPTHPPPPRSCSIHEYQHQLRLLGQDVTSNRGKMLHLILTLCQKVEKAFNRIVDGGEVGECWDS